MLTSEVECADAPRWNNSADKCLVICALAHVTFLVLYRMSAVNELPCLLKRRSSTLHYIAMHCSRSIQACRSASRLNDRERLHKASVYYRVIIAPPGAGWKSIEEREVSGTGAPSEAPWVAPSHG